MRTPATSLPALVLNEVRGGRVAYLPADLDRCLARDNLPDHADLLANAVAWAVGDLAPLRVEGPGLLDCHLYAQPGRLILHVVNLTNPAAWRPPAVDVYPVGPLTITVTGPDAPRIAAARCLVSQAPLPIARSGPHTRCTVPRVDDHEVVVFDLSGA